MLALFAGALVAVPNTPCQAQSDSNWIDHDRNRPMPPVVTPAIPSTPDQAGKAPSDAVALFDGKDLSQWVSMDGSPTKWIVKDGYMECVKGSGYIRTLQLFPESPTKFFAKSTDVQIEFKPDAEGKVNEIIWSVGEGANVAKRNN